MIEIFVHVVFTFCLGMQACSVRKLLVLKRLFCLCCAQLLYRNVCFLKLVRYYKYWIVGSDIILSSGYLCCTGWEKHFHWIQWNLKVNSSVFGCNEWATSLLRFGEGRINSRTIQKERNFKGRNSDVYDMCLLYNILLKIL